MRRRSYHVQILAGLLVVATILLMWFGYRATSEWQRSTRQVLDRRTVEVLYLMVTALSRDMRAVQGQVLPQLSIASNDAGIYEISDEVAKAFARFPYPDSFFSWTGGPSNEKRVLYAFNRADRPPSWHKSPVQATEFPTTLLKDPPELDAMKHVLLEQASLHTPFILFETTIDEEPYQVIARPVYVPGSRTTLRGIVGFTVNLNWVRTHYFNELAAQLSRVVVVRGSMVLEVLDENNALITSNRASLGISSDAGSTRERKFPLMFFDPVLRASAPAEVLPVRYWTARAQAAPDESILAAASGARRTFMLISFAAAAAVIALLLTARAARSAAILATMKSDFVSAVTHELKTPLSSIRLVSETLARGRFRSSEKVAEYASLLLNEVSRLTRTVDNLLTVSRVQDIQHFYTFESLDPGTLLEDALNSFHSHLKEDGFEVNVDIPAPLPTVYADRLAIIQVLENILDNAIRYSNGTRHLTISASAFDGQVSLKIADKGRGIPPEDVPHVFEKFYRGHDAAAGGSGLGLAIAQRIMKDHHGEVRLQSTPGAGTMVEIVLPLDKRKLEG